MVRKRVTSALVESRCDERKQEYADSDGCDFVKIISYADSVHKNRRIGNDHFYIEKCYGQRNCGNLEFVQVAECL